MTKFEFVRVKSELCGYGLGKATKYSFDGVEEIIKKRVKTDEALKVIFLLKQEEQGI